MYSEINMKLLRQSHVKYGLLMSGITVICILCMHLTGQYNNLQEKSPFELIFITVTPLVVWYFGIKARKQELKRKITYKQAFMEGVKISSVYAITSPFVFLAYYTFINPNLMDFMRKEYGLQDASDQMVIAFDMFVQFAAAMIGGTAYGALLSLFLKTKSKH